CTFSFFPYTTLFRVLPGVESGDGIAECSGSGPDAGEQLGRRVLAERDADHQVLGGQVGPVLAVGLPAGRLEGIEAGADEGGVPGCAGHRDLRQGAHCLLGTPGDLLGIRAGGLEGGRPMPSVCWVSTHSRCMELIWWLPSSAARSAAAVTASSERVVNWNSTGLLPWGAGVDEVMRGPGTAASYVVQRVRVESIPLKVVVRRCWARGGRSIAL